MKYLMHRVLRNLNIVEVTEKDVSSNTDVQLCIGLNTTSTIKMVCIFKDMETKEKWLDLFKEKIESEQKKQKQFEETVDATTKEKQETVMNSIWSFYTSMFPVTTKK